MVCSNLFAPQYEGIIDYEKPAVLIDATMGDVMFKLNQLADLPDACNDWIVVHIEGDDEEETEEELDKRKKASAKFVQFVTAESIIDSLYRTGAYGEFLNKVLGGNDIATDVAIEGVEMSFRVFTDEYYYDHEEKEWLDRSEMETEDWIL